MAKRQKTYRIWIALLLCLLQTAGIAMYGQDRPRAASKRHRHPADTTATARPRTPVLLTDSLGLMQRADSALHEVPDSVAVADSIAAANRKKMQEMTSATSPQVSLTPTDSLQKAVAPKVWVPNPTKATWLALVIPGGGQIYNRKFWKLPIFYGGFAGCAYALTWNGKMYRDYSNAYRDAVNENWTSSSILDLLPAGYLDRVSKTQLTETLRKRKDTYRRYRDLSIFAFIGVYLLSVVDAYVDAELSNFDISPDLSMSLEPAVIDNRSSGQSGRSVGVQCSFRF
ncbi:DUF5683 domain-containing protein [uncultured Bacteroides sp.]|uniref:DUF5683 domain-containing protein n=1 Tax=uncultured Bacteroides sp. TaxID=162156 RepID=UPI00260A9874|nr:DUF5683 domain-containing protein [uncultured Bacteroides sp.]